MAFKSGQQITIPALPQQTPQLSVVVDHSAALRWQEDAEYVKAAREGTQARRHHAFAQLVERYQDYVRNMLFGLCRDQALADELAQEALVNAWQKLDTLREPSRFQGWLKQLAYRQFLHFQRHQAVVERHREHTMLIQDDTVQMQELSEDWTRLLKPCSDLERELLVLVFGFEFSYAEIAAARQVPVGTVKSQIHRAKAKVADMLKESS